MLADLDAAISSDEDTASSGLSGLGDQNTGGGSMTGQMPTGDFPAPPGN